MKKTVLVIIVFFSYLTNVSAQIEVHYSNQIGIGTSTPEHKLHVVGDAFITGNVIGNFHFRSDSNFLGTTGNYPVVFKANNKFSGSTGSANNTNVSFGYESLSNYGTGSYNTAIGLNAGAGFKYDVVHNSTAIGFQAPITASNQVRIGNNTVNSIGGSVSWSNLSDGRAAKNIRNDVPGLTFINGIQPVTYNMDLNALDEMTSGGKKLLSQIQVGETLGGNKIIFDTTKNLGKRIGTYSRESLTIYGENGWNLCIKYWEKYPAYHYVRIHLLDPAGVIVEEIYYSNAFAPGAGNEMFEWEWQQSEITVPLAFGKITSIVDTDRYGLLNVSYNWTLNDAWVEPPGPGSQAMDDVQLQAREDKEAQVQTGFVAQDVEAAAQSAGYDFSGVDVDAKTGIYSLRYAEFVVPLVKAIQELSEQNDRLREQIDELNNRIETLESK